MLARKSLLIVYAHFFTRFVGWIGLVILARSWGGGVAPEALGNIAFAMSFLALFNIIADLGFSRAHVKRISEGEDLGTCIGTYATIKLLLTGLMVTIVFLFVFLGRTIWPAGFFDSTQESILVAFVFYYVFLDLTQIASYTFEGTQEIAKRELIHIFGSIKTPLMVLIAFAGTTGVMVKGNIVNIDPAFHWPEFLQPLQRLFSEHSFGSLAMAYTAAMVGTFASGIWLLRKYKIKKPSFTLLKSYFSFALPTVLYSVIAIISLNIDKLMIGFYWDSANVGYYYGVQQILQIIMVLYIAVGIVLFPTISKFHANNDMKKIKNTTHMAERYISMIMIPPVVFIIALVYPVMSTVLSSNFLPATNVMITLALYTFIFSLNRPYSALINGMNRPGVTTKVGFAMCFVNIPLNLLFIPHNGLLSPIGINGPTGAAVATVLSVLVGFFGLRYYAKKLTGIKILQTHTPRHIFAGIVVGILLHFLVIRTNLFPEIYWYFLLLFAGIGLAVYLGVLYLLREFNKEDLKFFLDIAHPKKMMKYISSELKEKPEQKK